MEQVLANLPSKAMKASRVVGTVSMCSFKVPGNQIRIEVRDTGPRILADLKPRFFQKFEQGDTGNTRKSSGAGLGLSIPKAMTDVPLAAQSENDASDRAPAGDQSGPGPS